MFPAVVWDREICEATGGTCLPDIFAGPDLPSDDVSQVPEGYGCPPPVQRHMQIPFELCPDYSEWMENRYIWELSEIDD